MTIYANTYTQKRTKGEPDTKKKMQRLAEGDVQCKELFKVKKNVYT